MAATPLGTMTPTRSPGVDADGDQESGDAARPSSSSRTSATSRRIDDRGPLAERGGAGLEVVDQAGDGDSWHVGYSARRACFRSTNAAMSSMRSKLSMSVSCASTSMLELLFDEADQAKRRQRVEDPARTQRRVVAQVLGDSPGR